MRGNRPLYFLALAGLPLILVLQAPERQTFVHQISLTLLKPFLQTGRFLSQSLRQTQEGLTQFWSLTQNHGALVRRVDELEQNLVAMEELKKENERLRKLLEFKTGIPGRAVAARVIGWDPAPWRRTLLIDKGTQQGIQNRMAVISAEGLVGRVVEAGPFASRVIALLDPESRASALFQENRDLGVVEGDGSTFLKVTHIDRESPIKMGDRLISSGYGNIYPKGILIGTVEMVGTEKNGLELFSVAKPSVNFSKLEEVLCVSSSPQNT